MKFEIGDLIIDKIRYDPKDINYLFEIGYITRAYHYLENEYFDIKWYNIREGYWWNGSESSESLRTNVEKGNYTIQKRGDRIES